MSLERGFPQQAPLGTRGFIHTGSGHICEEVACSSIATMADLAAAELEEIQQGTSEALRRVRLQERNARIEEARTKLQRDREALDQAEAAASVAREREQNESDLKDMEDQIAIEQAAITARLEQIAEEQDARDANRASGATSKVALQVIKENAAAAKDMMLEDKISQIEDMLTQLKKALIPPDEVVGFVEEFDLPARGTDVGAAIIGQSSGLMTTVQLAGRERPRVVEGFSAALTATEASIVEALEVKVQVSEILALLPKPIIPRRISTGDIPSEPSIQPSFIKNCIGEMGDAVMGLIVGIDTAIARMAYEYSQLLATKMQVPMEVRMSLFRRIEVESGPIQGTPGEAFILAATQRTREVERGLVGGLLVGHTQLVPSVQALVRQCDRDGNDNAIRNITEMLHLQVVAKAPPLQDARLAVQYVKDYHPTPSSTVGALGAAVALRRSMIRTAEEAALAAGASTGFSLDGAKQQLNFVAEQLTSLDVEGQKALDSVRSDLIMARLDERSVIDVDKNVDRIVVVVEAERAMRLASRRPMPGGRHGAGTDTKAAEIKAAELKAAAAQAAEVKAAEAKVAEAKATTVKAKAKADAEARAAMSAAAAGIRANAAVAAVFPGTCFNCGVAGHRKSECTAVGRCARCQQPGHAARVCTAPAPVSP